MHEALPFPLAAWESFYVIVGTSAGALTGLTFVVIALIAEAGPRNADSKGIATFITPTIVHFCITLLVSVILSAPWPNLHCVAIALGLTAVAGVGYTAIVLLRARRVEGYKLVLEDWLLHTLFPFLAYAGIGLAALWLDAYPMPALFAVGAVAVLLLFIGIHNAWDTVTHVTIRRLDREKDKES